MSADNQDTVATLRALPNGQRAMRLAQLTAEWLAEHPPETWDTLMMFQSSTVQSLARLERPAPRRRRKSGTSGDAVD